MPLYSINICSWNAVKKRPRSEIYSPSYYGSAVPRGTLRNPRFSHSSTPTLGRGEFFCAADLYIIQKAYTPTWNSSYLGGGAVCTLCLTLMEVRGREGCSEKKCDENFFFPKFTTTTGTLHAAHVQLNTRLYDTTKVLLVFVIVRMHSRREMI